MNLIFLMWATLATTYGYHILCLFPIPTKSHHHLGKGMVNALLEAGHEVTWATPYPPDKPSRRLNIIDASVTKPVAQSLDMFSKQQAKPLISFMRELSKNLSETTASIPALREAVVKKHFDAVVTETFFSDADAGYAAVLQAPWIVLSCVSLQPYLESLVDDVKSVSTIPLLLNNHPIPMNFWQRTMNTFIYGVICFYSWTGLPISRELYESIFTPLAGARGVPLPPFEDALYNISVLFVNSHPSMTPAQSLPPNVIEIGGYHIQENIPPLPEDLQSLLDSSSRGVIYFSMGSVFQSTSLSVRIRKELLRVLSELPYTVLWKFEGNLEAVPKNVHVRRWMPQASILAHPNVKIFITHGGLLSTLEAIHYGVPLLAVPVFADQPANADRAVSSGYALKVTFGPEMAGDMKVALNEMLTNDSYYKQVKFLSKIFRHRPVAPSKLISHYIELAIESKGAYHLRSKALLYNWYERKMLDQATAALGLLIVLYVISKRLYRAIVSKCKYKKDKGNKKMD